MTEVSVTFKGDKKFARRMKKAPKKVRGEAGRRLLRAGEILAGAAKKEIRGSRTRAKREGRPVTARPNRLGIDTGRGRQAISVKQRRGGKIMEVIVAAFGVAYMSIHELRGKYVWLRPAVRASAKRIKVQMGKVFKVV